jgi:hypothetical protein
MGVDTGLTIVDGVIVLTVQTTSRGLLYTTLVLVLTIISLHTLYKWTERRRKAKIVHSNVAPTFFLPDEVTKEWVNPSKLKKKAKRNKKRPGHIPAYDEWPEYEAEHRQMLAEQSKERVRAKRRAKRKRARDNKWFRQNS